MQGKQKGKSVLVAMSGGVDSSVAAHMMLSRGFVTEGAMFRMYRGEDDPGLESDINDAEKVCSELGIPLSILDFREDFKREIVEKFIRVYEEGGTPNPCVDCNRTVKFGKLLDFARSRGLEYIATGHYARVEFSPETGRYQLKKALSAEKDQSYVLCNLTQEQLSRIIFPLGESDKAEVRSAAGKLGFDVAEKKDSQDICFIPDGDYAAFMERYTGKKYPCGKFLDVQGNEIGEHRGAVRYTIGQRKGLGLAMGEPVYVCRKCMENNTVTVGKEEFLFKKTLIAKDFNWVSIECPEREIRAKAKARYRQSEAWATVFAMEDGRVRITFDEPQRAMTEGQTAVIYDGDILLGGGVIESIED